MAQTNLGNMFRLFSTVWEPVSLRQADLVVSGTLQSDAKVVWEALGLPAAPVEAFADDLSSYLGRDANEVMHELRPRGDPAVPDASGACGEHRRDMAEEGGRL